MRPSSAAGVLAALLAIAATVVPGASAHGTFEAQELEVHVLNDEGSDLIESYGGYDIQEAFLGSAYLEEHGDAVYVRLILYGQITDTTAAQPWTVRVSYVPASGQTQAHELTTTNGVDIDHDFLALESEYDAEERTLQVHRAYLGNGAPLPGQTIRDLVVESFWGEDLRDIAPGGIPAPVVGGVAGPLTDIPDPTAIEGGGRLTDAPTPPTTDAYFGNVSASVEGNRYTIQATNGLRAGGQHVNLVAAQQQGWAVNPIQPTQVLAANQTGTFVVEATPIGELAQPLVLELASDVGGRLALTVRADGSMEARGATIAQPAQAVAVESPSAGILLALGGLGLAFARRHAVRP